MDYKLTSYILWTCTYIAYAIWIAIGIILLTSFIKRKWDLLKRTFKYALNTSVFIFALMFIMELALIVRPAIYETRQASSNALKLTIQKHQANDIYIDLMVLLILFLVNLFFHFKVEKKQYQQDLFILAAFDIFVLSIGIWVTGLSAYFGLMQEINRHFG